MGSTAAVTSSNYGVNPGPGKAKLHGRAFYESLGSPKHVLAPMVAQSEFAWRMLTRSFIAPSDQSNLLAYSPMLHARLYAEKEPYRQNTFQPTRSPCPSSSSPSSATANGTPPPWLDGNPSIDRPLFVQFCANDPDILLEAAKRVAPYCDAVDLNLGCPQGIARKGHYGAFLQEDQELIYRLINTLHRNLDIPVTAKIRILETREATLAYAKKVLNAGASILTVHGRRREQKGHLTGLADWSTIRWLRGQLPPETVLFANGNILQHADLARCLEATGADAVMSAEGNLSDPGLFAAPPPPGQEGREYWRGRDGRGGWRVDAVFRRYLDILHRFVAEQDPPARRPLFVPGDDTAWMDEMDAAAAEAEEPARKKQKRSGADGKNNNNNNKKKKKKRDNGPLGPNLMGMQPHMFHLLRHLVTRHTDIRDMLARTSNGDLEAYETILTAVERKVADGLLEYERTGGRMFDDGEDEGGRTPKTNGTSTCTTTSPDGETATKDAVSSAAGGGQDPPPPNGSQQNGLEGGTAAGEGKSNGKGQGEDEGEESSAAAVRRCRRPWWVAQPIVRPLPREAMAKGAIQLSKKDKEKLLAEEEEKKKASKNGTLKPSDEGSAAVSVIDVEARVLETDDKLLAG
ncbi:Dus-domain-containing protein [Sodiomyces alkalinus F11]|uniref:tRNA-dihydrouridine(16/17) synthase [NAD(P)(+)] n=1 Tax=Sodiomyces alkalinus (strain CBS 110278 / VKM F-3762 / F11) TaxID=1314773 RepID=A0A3N2PMP6_SODAK|nr:Dus-domain-containing protein [Sodiomyces alkalinus F11]ROT35684.1 Dus-domain-containing protein [Sodiomyces alkalinus F11]